MARNTPKKDKPETTEPTRNGLRNQAERIVLDRHRDEYHEEAARLFAERGWEYTRRATPEEQAAKKEAVQKAKDEEKLRKLLEASPHLRERLAAVIPNNIATNGEGTLDLTASADNGMNTGAVGA